MDVGIVKTWELKFELNRGKICVLRERDGWKMVKVDGGEGGGDGGYVFSGRGGNFLGGFGGGALI